VILGSRWAANASQYRANLCAVSGAGGSGSGKCISQAGGTTVNMVMLPAIVARICCTSASVSGHGRLGRRLPRWSSSSMSNKTTHRYVITKLVDYAWARIAVQYFKLSRFCFFAYFR
jgi:hypothetical protein